MGVEEGGEQAGDSLGQFAEFSESVSQGLSTTGEVLGVFAGQLRMQEDWQLQLSTATSDVAQIVLQEQAARGELTVAQRDLEITQAQIAQNESVSDVPAGQVQPTRSSTSGWPGSSPGCTCRPITWPTSWRRAAERAFQFERGVGRERGELHPAAVLGGPAERPAGGRHLGLDLRLMAKAAMDADARGLEIVKRISLADLDPVALLQLKSTGRCEFSLTEVAVRLRLPRPLPTSDPVAVGRLRRRRRRGRARRTPS